MTDIVERLRRAHPQSDDGEVRHQAADEIERLRAALRIIAAPKVKIVYCRDGHEMAVLIARDALRENSHD